ncbi:murein transglycosylase A [Aureimonas mangrovi]|uniref:murein transglycosylase A n=1 Tax=Aureimonas mangrovi TaxID=2758041 RepID=UPI00163D71B1|nr:MltA domain-containing protein [Aureimonas mangrovi]
MNDAAFRPLAFEQLPGWRAADFAPALDAFRRSAARILSDAPPKSGALGVSAASLRPAAHAALRPVDDSREFFERFFSPALVVPEGGRRGFVTGYYEPVIEASAERTARFTVPLHRPPPDLVPVRGETPGRLPEGFAFARRQADGSLVEHPDRAAIARGFLDGRGLEIAWLEDPVDAFFIHVQGSARLKLTDGRTIRVGYAAKTGHGFTAIGRILVNEGELVLEKADMDGIRAWLATNPDRVRGLLDRNRSYIFFEPREIEDESLGPPGAAGVPLTPLASLALDHRLHTFGMPLFLHAPSLVIEGVPFARPMVVQDTGSAITGPARGDIFVGSGAAAGSLAGAVRHAADFYALLPKAPAP